MQTVYNALINLSGIVLKSAGFFSGKLQKFTEGRKELFPKLENFCTHDQKRIWVHAASLGEFEMAVPVLKVLKEEFPDHQIVVSFFSPSGYENKKKHQYVDFFTYLPLDTPHNAQQFLEILAPEMAIFVKYDFWPNFLLELKRRKIRSFLISGVFKSSQLFFQSYGKWMQKSLQAFEHFFVQDKRSAELLKQIGFTNCTVAGDNRFDRVAAQLEGSNSIDFIETFKNDKTLFVFGSSWPADEALYIDFINKNPSTKFLIAPHEIHAEKIARLESRLKLQTLKYSEMKPEYLAKSQVFILDTIGYLGKSYSYADIAYVGGAAGNTGLHNVLEPATFGIPIITGEHIQKFPEALQLEKLAGLFKVSTASEFEKIAGKLLTDIEFRQKTGMISGHFINSNTGATKIFQEYISL